MSNKKSTLRALVFSGLAMLLSISMLVGTTFAWFTDSVVSGNNKILAGNLDIEVDYLASGEWKTVEEASEIFNPAALWEPGHVEVAYFRIKNAGTLALKYSLLMNVVKYGDGINVYGEEFQLADYINIAIVEDVDGSTDAYATRDAAVDAALADVAASNRTNPRTLGDHTAERVTNDALLSGEEEFFAVVIWMPEEVDNHANYKKGTPAPVVEFGVHVMATQTPHESDSFDNQYDANIALDDSAVGTADITTPGLAAVELIGTTAAGYNLVSAVVDIDSFADGVTNTAIKAEKSNYVADVPVTQGYTATCYDVTIEGLRADNDIPFAAEIKIPLNVDPATVKAYHYDEEITSTYNPETGWVSFKSLNCSPFTIVYDANSTYVPNNNPEDLPVANVAPYLPTEPIAWGQYGQWSPAEGIEAELDAIYEFSCTETLEEAKVSKYANWYCDFYVVLDENLGENEIFLGGNYGSFGWVGFHNGDLTLEANTEIGLLESVTTNPWTYVDVVQNVGTFICGVGNVDDSLEGATFKVMLRLTNPENENEFYNVETIYYKWVSNTASN